MLVGLGLDAGLPGHDAVQPGVNGRGRDRNRPGDLLTRGQPLTVGVQVIVAQVDALGAALPGVGQRERAAQRDDLPDLLGELAGEFPGVDPAQAPAHHRDRPAGELRERRQGPRQPVQDGVGRAYVAPEVPAAHLIADQVQELPEQRRATVRRQQPRHDQHPVAVATRRGREPRRSQRQSGQAGQPTGGLGQVQLDRRSRHRASGSLGTMCRSPDQVHRPRSRRILATAAKRLIQPNYMSHCRNGKPHLSGIVRISSQTMPMTVKSRDDPERDAYGSPPMRRFARPPAA
jgi:hypothetical protein